MANLYLNFNYHKLLCVLLFCTTTLFAQVPQISSFSPVSGPIGTSVIISGTNFNVTAANNTVYFGSVKASITATSSTSLTVNVPIGTTYSPISVTTGNLTAYSRKPFVVTYANSSNSIKSTSFNNNGTINTGKRPHSISSADFNGDGKIDLVTADYDDNTISVLKNIYDSELGFSFSKTSYACGSGAFGVTTGDVNGDGKIDIAVANYFAGTVSVFKNTSTSGSISFDAKVDFYSGEGPRIVSIGDFDSDGKPDLAVVNDDDNTISIFKNLGSGGSISFGSKTTYYPNSHPRDVVIGDLDGDGKPDLAVANFSSNNISLYRNTSTTSGISFSSSSSLTAGSSPRCIAIADLNNDGLSDLAVTNHEGSSISIFKNSSTSGTISFSSKADFVNEANPYGVSANDLDGDGKADLAVANLVAGTVSVHKNTSSGSTISFANRVDFSAQYGSIGVAIADLNNDGKSDLAVANDYSSSISILGFASTTLPVSLIEFKGRFTNNSSLITWKTSAEKNTSYFDIEYLQNNEFISLGQVAADGNSDKALTYKFTHYTPVQGSNYYRLKTVDVDGSVSYSNILTIVSPVTSSKPLTIFPNPTNRTSITVQYQELTTESLLRITDGHGKELKKVTLKKGSSESVLDITGFQSGIYIITVEGLGIQQSQKLIVE